MSGGLGQISNVIGMIIGLAIVATLATHPAIVTDFFTGVSTATTAAEKG